MNFLRDLITRLCWWVAFRSAATLLSRSVFTVRYLLEFSALSGFLLGLVPAARLRGWFANGFGRVRYRDGEYSVADLDWMRPAMWAWVLPSLFFLLRFATYRVSDDHSVLSHVAVGHERLTYFFGVTTDYDLSIGTLSWFWDRSFVTAPVLFLMAYPFAVWLRHRVSASRGARVKEDFTAE